MIRDMEAAPSSNAERFEFIRWDTVVRCLKCKYVNTNTKEQSTHFGALS